MLIDWFTVGAQVVNFLILLWLMKHFLYKPVLNAIDARAKKITDELAAAQSKEAEATEKNQEFTKKNEDFDKERKTLLDKATADADKHHAELLNRVRKEIEDLRAQQTAAFSNEQKALRTDLRQRAMSEVFDIARKTLSTLADVSLEEQIIAILIRQIRELKEPEKSQFTQALNAQSPAPVIRSAYKISAEQRQQIELALKELFGVVAAIKYEVKPELVSGIELSANGKRMAWNISGYLDSLSESLDDIVRAAVSKNKVETPTLEPDLESV